MLDLFTPALIKHDNFQLYSAHPDRVIWKILTNDDKYINEQLRLFIHHMCLKRVEKKEILRCNLIRKTFLWKSVQVRIFEMAVAKCVYETQKN